MDALAATMVVDRNAAAYSARRKSDAAIAKKNWRLVQNSVRVLGEVKHASHHAAKLVPKDDIAYGLKVREGPQHPTNSYVNTTLMASPPSPEHSRFVEQKSALEKLL